MSSLTPYMDLVLPDIATYNSLGTLPQDWALYINQNIVTIDNHDHAEIGKQVASTDISTISDIELNGVNLLKVNYCSFSGTDTYALRSLFSDGVDLFWCNYENTVTQITKAGALNIINTVGGFFGDYGAASAVAKLDGGWFGLFGNGPSNPDNAKIEVAGIICTSTDGLIECTNITMSNSLIATNKSVLNLTQTTPPRLIATNSAPNYQMSNVVGDGSNYSQTLHNVPITDPNGIYHYNRVDVYPTPASIINGRRVSPNTLVNVRSNVNKNDYLEMFASAQEAPFNRFMTPGSKQTITIRHEFPLMAKIPHWDGKFTVSQCRWALRFFNSFSNGVNSDYKSVLANIFEVKHISGRTFDVTGTILNNTDTTLVLPDSCNILSTLWICAIFPKFNGEGVFFGEQY